MQTVSLNYNAGVDPLQLVSDEIKLVVSILKNLLTSTLFSKPAYNGVLFWGNKATYINFVSKASIERCVILGKKSYLH